MIVDDLCEEPTEEQLKKLDEWYNNYVVPRIGTEFFFASGGTMDEARDFISKKEHLEILELHDTEMRRSMKDSIIGAIQDLHSGNNTVQVMMRWSREFYDEIQKAGESKDSQPDGDVGERRRE